MAKVTRRDAAKLLGLVPALGAGATMARAAVQARPFPKGFQWGCATASYQIEGAVKEDGRGETIWDVFSHTPGKIKDGTNGDIACDSYHRYADDRKCLQAVGANIYRLSFAWSRIFPEGKGKPNRKGVDHYKRVIDDLLEAGITPFVTLFHWDLPTGLAGGWRSRDTALAFADYAGFVAKEFSDRIENYITVNEIRSFIDIGYGQGRHAPGEQLAPRELNQARHHGLLAHGLGTQAIRASARKPVKVGMAENSYIPIPAIETPAFIEAARKGFRWLNARHLMPMIEGRYSDEYGALEGANAVQPQAGDMAAIGSPLDFIGLNIYTGDYVAPDEGPQGFRVVKGSATYPTMGLKFLRVAPAAAYWGPRLLTELAKPKAIYVAENGTLAQDELVRDGQVDDAERIMYLDAYMGQLQRATAEGHPVAGYMLWSLMDNFEWAEGYGARFGIFYTDFATQRRLPKLSAEWFRELVARNALV